MANVVRHWLSYGGGPTEEGCYAFTSYSSGLLGSTFRPVIRVMTLGLIWPTRRRIDIVLRPDPRGGTLVETRSLSHTQVLYVIPWISTDAWEEENLAKHLVWEAQRAAKRAQRGKSQ